MTDSNLQHYDEKFFEMLERHKEDYYRVADWIAKNIRGVVFADIGCGRGYILERLHLGHMKTVWGVDGAKCFEKFIPRAILPYCKKVDLTEKNQLGYADVAICIEVAEHLEEQFADKLVTDIVETEASVILFTAAKPNQGGVNHLNLQPQEYWIEKFKKHKKRLNQRLTTQYKNDLIGSIDSAGWLLHNMMIFTR